MLAAIACLILVLALMLGGKTFTADNLYYLYKDISSMNRPGETIATTLSYTAPESAQDLVLYKKGLAVASDREVKIFNSTGRVTLTLGSEMRDPRILSCDKYVLVYDEGSGGFSVYNSFDRLYTETPDHFVSTAALADGGSFAVVTKTQEYRSSVTVYDSDFSPIASYGKNDYIISVDFDDSGRYLAIASIDSAQGDYRTSFTVLDCERAEVCAKTSFDGVLAYRCDFVSADRFALFCSDRVMLLDTSCEKNNEYIYGEGELDRISCGDGTFALLFARDGIGEKRELLVFDRFGNESYRQSVSGECGDMTILDRFVFLARDGRVERIDTRTGETRYAECNTDGARILVADQEKIMVCNTKAANIINTWN